MCPDQSQVGLSTTKVRVVVQPLRQWLRRAKILPGEWRAGRRVSTILCRRHSCDSQIWLGLATNHPVRIIEGSSPERFKASTEISNVTKLAFLSHACRNAKPIAVINFPGGIAPVLCLRIANLRCLIAITCLFSFALSGAG